MHVLVVTTVHVPTDARILHRQIRALLDAGHRVTYAAAFRERGQPPPAGVDVVDLPAARGRRRVRSLLAARRLLSRPPAAVDLVVVHDPELLLAVATTRRRTPVVWDVHEDLRASLTDKAWLPGRLRRSATAAVAGLERWAEGRCHLLLAEDDYQARFRRTHPVVPNLPWLRPAPTAGVRPQAVYVGRVSRGRGAEDLVALGDRLKARGVEVVVVGPADPEVHDLLREAAGRRSLQWHGYLPNPEALALLDGALVGLALLRDEPNYRHSMPTKVLEYMERGLPVITTPLPLAREIVERHQCGTVVPFSDPAAVAEAVLHLHADPPGRSAMARRAREAAVEHYTWDGRAPAFVGQLEQWASAR